MKDYNFMISDNNRLHKTRFSKKRGATKTFLIKTGVGANGEGRGGEGLQFHILRGLTFLRGVIAWCPTMLENYYFIYLKKSYN